VKAETISVQDTSDISQLATPLACGFAPSPGELCAGEFFMQQFKTAAA
jgi:hypothetical protein